MRSTRNKRKNNAKKNTNQKFFFFLIFFIILILFIIILNNIFNNSQTKEQTTISINSNNVTDNATSENLSLSQESTENTPVSFTLTALGDALCHNTQYIDAYNKNTGEYDFWKFRNYFCR